MSISLGAKNSIKETKTAKELKTLKIIIDNLLPIGQYNFFLLSTTRIMVVFVSPAQTSLSAKSKFVILLPIVYWLVNKPLICVGLFVDQPLPCVVLEGAV